MDVDRNPGEYAAILNPGSAVVCSMVTKQVEASGMDELSEELILVREEADPAELRCGISLPLESER